MQTFLNFFDNIPPILYSFFLTFVQLLNSYCYFNSPCLWHNSTHSQIKFMYPFRMSLHHSPILISSMEKYCTQVIYPSWCTWFIADHFSLTLLNLSSNGLIFVSFAFELKIQNQLSAKNLGKITLRLAFSIPNFFRISEFFRTYFELFRKNNLRWLTGPFL